MIATLDIASRLARAESTARRAGALALEHFHNRERLVIEAKRHPTDLVSEADREVEHLIRKDLSGAFPGDAQLGEELGLSPGTSGLTWIIDPIDGTAPYLNGLPGWCVSIGACDAEGPVIGVIYAPLLGEMFVSARGQGATLNGNPIRVTDRFDLRTGLIGIGANDRVSAQRLGQMIEALAKAGASWTRYGSGALMLAWVAAGRLVGYAEPRMSAWDCMAGYSLILAAGGEVLPFPTGGALQSPAPVLGARPGTYLDLLALCRLQDDVFWQG